MKFIGTASQLKTFFDTLIAVFGEDAKISAIESKIKALKVVETWNCNLY